MTTIQMHQGEQMKYEVIKPVAALVKTSGRKVTAFVVVDDVTFEAAARCHPDDQFDFTAGRQLAIARAMHLASTAVLQNVTNQIDLRCAQREARARLTTMQKQRQDQRWQEWERKQNRPEPRRGFWARVRGQR